jgi:NADH-quinone oxidoreductase subunit N
MEYLLPTAFSPALPEILLGLGICIVLLVDLYLPPRLRDITYLLALATLGVTALAIGNQGLETRDVVLGGSFVADPLAAFLKLFSLALLATVLVYSRAHLHESPYNKGEYYVLSLFAALGIFVMISGASLLTLYLGLEMQALALYAMVAFNRDSPVAAEAAMKYFVLGAIASGCLLYGISLLYGITGSVQIEAIATSLRSDGAQDPATVVAVAFVVVGIAFKFGAVPFHMWVPDVYQGAPVSVALLVGTVPKLGAFALTLRVLVEGLGEAGLTWEPMLAVLAVLSLAIGNIVAIAQTNLRRMLAYSTIAHVGFILLGFMAGSRDGIEAALFYTVVYVVMAAGAFGIVILMGRQGNDADDLDDLKGLSQRSPWFALLMLLLMVSMIGVPPLAGFYAKWWILAALLDGGHLGLAIAAVLFSVIGAFYYLRVVKLMYFDAPQDPGPLRQGAGLRLTLTFNALLVLAVGVFPDGLIELCARALG